MARTQRGELLRAAGAEFGWVRVEPPPGVFSFVGAEFVEILDGSRGRVKIRSGTLRVRVGSLVQELDPARSDVQTWLSDGAEVQVIERAGDWLKIVPPEGVFLYISEVFAEPVIDQAAAEQEYAGRAADFAATLGGIAAGSGQFADGKAKQVDEAGNPLPGAGADSPHAATRPAQPVDPPQTARVDTSGPWGRQLTDIERRIEDEAGKPVLDQEWSGKIGELRPIAAQTEEPMVAQLALAWIARLEARITQQERIRKAEQITRREAAGREQFEREMSHIRRAQEKSPEPPFDAKGLLSASFADGPAVPRYRLSSPLTRRIEAYVEFPAQSQIRPADLEGRYVGVRGSRRRDARLGADVIEVREIVIIDVAAGPGPASQPAQRAQRSTTRPAGSP